ncbi:Uncharacterised protein [Legionella wadsworthii]|uniref:Coiled-coil protein n=1 Tax=Legionella wadsworthii TaxID=28088 RepID=A0A378LQJ3_9GAMM|nr:hypothetical protein [Legionella wadsworthii]STY28620.1 Uncharacterised protein [Legionella wadsworthii]
MKENKFINLNIEQLQSAIAHIQCLAQELELFNDSLNYISHCNTPLGNIILSSLSEIENKLFITYSEIKNLNFNQKSCVHCFPYH